MLLCNVSTPRNGNTSTSGITPLQSTTLFPKNVILTVDGDALGHEDGPKQGAILYGKDEETWKL